MNMFEKFCEKLDKNPDAKKGCGIILIFVTIMFTFILSISLIGYIIYRWIHG